MTRLLLALLFLVLVSGPGFAHGVSHDGEGGGAKPSVSLAVDPAVEAPGPVRHRHDGSGSFHCAVSASCAPLFLLSGGGALPGMALVYAPWPMARDALRRGSALERDPPVPRA